MKQHFQRGRGSNQLQDTPWNTDIPPWNQEDTLDIDLQETYEANGPIILHPLQRGDVNSIFNFPCDNLLDANTLLGYKRNIFHEMNHSFKMNISLGIILRDIYSGRHRYFKPHTNANLFQEPFYINSLHDLERLREVLQEINFSEHLLYQRPNTNWKPFLITNVRIDVFRSNFALGSYVKLPHYVKDNRFVIGLTHSKKTGKAYNDKLCIFRCLSTQKGCHRRQLEIKSKELFKEWLEFKLSKHR